MNIRPGRTWGIPFSQWLLLLAALLIIGGVIGWNVHSEHIRIDAEERARLLGQIGVLDQNLGRQLHAMDLVLLSIRSDLPFLERQKNRTALINGRLQAMSETMPGIRTLLLLDADGTGIASNREQLIGQNFRAREYFQNSSRGGNPDLLYVSPPYETVLGVFAISVTKVVFDNKGVFAGIITATLEPDYFKTLLNSVRYAPDMRSALIHGDGKVIFRIPDPQGIIGIDLAARPGAFFVDHLKSGHATTAVAGVVAATGEPRLTILRTVQPGAMQLDKPLVLAVSRELSALFSPWRANAYKQGGLFGLLVLGSTLGLAFHQKQKRAYERLESNEEAERKRTEIVLRQSEERYRALIEWSPDPIVVLRDGIFIYLNPAATRMYGARSEQDLIGKSFLDRVHPDFQHVVLGRRKNMTDYGSDTPLARLVYLKLDGTAIDAEAQATWIVYSGMPAVHVSIRDVTERAQAAEALQKSEANFKKLVEYNPLSMALVASDGTIEYINLKAIEVFGYLHQDIPNMDRWWPQAYPDEAYRAEVFAQWMGLVGEALSHKREIEPREYHVTCKNGSVKIVSIFGVWIASKVLVIFDDVTERKRLQQRLRRLNEELEERVQERTAALTSTVDTLQSEVEERQLAERSALLLAERLQNMARRLGEAQEIERQRLAAELHDGVCSNLAAIGLNAALLQRQLSLTDAADVEQRFSALIALIDEAKANAKDISIDLRPLLLENRDLRPALEEYARRFEDSTALSVKVSGTDSNRRLQAVEKIALFRITQEALTNCAKHAHAKGVAIEFHSGTDYLALSIADDGIGIDLAGSGGTRSGLGLLSMQERAEAIGGKWRIESAPGMGTRVTVSVGTKALA